MKHSKAGIKSTWKKEAGRKWHENKTQEEPTIILEDDPNSETHEFNNLFCYTALLDKQNVTLYTDATGTLLTTSLDDHRYYFIAYDYDTNYVFAIPIKDATDDSIIEAFDQMFTELKEKGLTSTFNVMDN